MSGWNFWDLPSTLQVACVKGTFEREMALGGALPRVGCEFFSQCRSQPDFRAGPSSLRIRACSVGAEKQG
jgi:hypothetical protein